jgi:hypothetical protein
MLITWFRASSRHPLLSFYCVKRIIPGSLALLPHARIRQPWLTMVCRLCVCARAACACVFPCARALPCRTCMHVHANRVPSRARLRAGLPSYRYDDAPTQPPRVKVPSLLLPPQRRAAQPPAPRRAQAAPTPPRRRRAAPPPATPAAPPHRPAPCHARPPCRRARAHAPPHPLGAAGVPAGAAGGALRRVRRAAAGPCGREMGNSCV